MKNQYFGDVNDYRKYGLLRVLTGNSGLTLSVGWMLTPPDEKRVDRKTSDDGKFVGYLNERSRWRQYDEDLFDHLHSSVVVNKTRSVEAIERSTLLPKATFFSEVVPDEKQRRETWGRRLVDVCAASDLAFLDPDNGIEVPSKPIGGKNSSKYVAWNEIRDLWRGGCSLLIYQHFHRVKRDIFTPLMSQKLAKALGGARVQAFLAGQVLFLLAIQHRHCEAIDQSIREQLPRWRDQIRPQ